MDSLEIQFERRLKYRELCQYLQNKYGLPKYSYFLSPESNNPTSKIKRSNEGLFIHHVFEDVSGDLSKKESMKANPFSYQEPNNLVYCNYLEHFLLHLLITKEAKHELGKKILGLGGILNHFCCVLNHYYSYGTLYSSGAACHAAALDRIKGRQKYKALIEAKDNQLEPVKDNFEDYLSLLKETDMLISSNEVLKICCVDYWKKMFLDGEYSKYTSKIYKEFVKKYGIPKTEAFYCNFANLKTIAK